MSRATNIVITALLLLVLNVLPVLALQENFDIKTTTNSPLACSFTVTTNSIIVTNIGDVESSYSLSAQGDAAVFTTYSAQTFSLKPGESQTIFVYYAPGNHEGSYSIETTVKTAFGLSKSITHTIEAKNCANINLNVKNSYMQSNPCQVSQFSFNVKNTGDFAEMFDFGAKGLEQYTTLNTPSAFLSPGESKQVDLFINPSCGIYGAQKLTFQAFARTTQFLAQAPVVLDIAQAYDYVVQIHSQVKACNYKQTAIPVTIKNNVPFINQYDIKVSGPSFMKQEAYRVELNPLGTGTTVLVADRPENAGVYNVDVTFTSLRGDVVKAGTTQVTVEDCYDSDVNVAEPADVVVQGHTQTYQTTVKNEGTKDDTYTFTLNAPSWVSSDAQKVTLKAGESKIFTLTAKTNETGSFTALSIAQSQETGQNTTDSIKFKVISQEDAYGLSIKNGNTRVLTGSDSFKVTLKNNGILPATYDLKLNAPAFITLPANSVSLKPGESAEMIIPTSAKNGTQLGDYEAELVATVHGESVGFSSKFNVHLRQLTVTQEFVQFAIRYWIALAALVVLLLIALFIKIFGSRISRSFRTWKIRRAEIAKFNAVLKAQQAEEKKARALLKAQMKAMKPSRFWKIVLGVLVVLLCVAFVAGIVLAAIGYFPFINEFFKQQAEAGQQFDSIIKVNTTGLEAYGNTVIVRGKDVTIPVIVKNNYNKDLRFDVQVSAAWIKTDTEQIELAPGKQEIVNLHVTPSDAEKGLYKIHVSATLEQENKRFNEDITLNVRKQSIVQDILEYLPYFIGGLVAVVLLALFGKRIKFAKRKEVKPMPKKVFAPVRRVSIDIPMRK